MVAGLMDFDSYNLTLEQISKLTIRQISFLYYADRNKDGQRRQMPYYFYDKNEQMENNIAQFRAMGVSMGKSPEEIEQIIANAIKMGSI